MKAIVCELCGSNEFVKEDKYFVCQYCGTKYSVEDAKKLLVEGTVKIDESNKLSNMLKNAEDLYYDGKTEEAYKLFGEVLNIDTKCSRAILYRGLCSSWETTINKPKLFDCIKGLEKALKIEDESFEKRTKLSEDGLREIDKLSSAIELLYRNNFNDYINAANKLTEKAQSSIYRYGLDVNANFYMEQLLNQD